MKREYRLANLVRPSGYPGWQDIAEVSGGHRKVILTVPETCAENVRDALDRAYQDGREDSSDDKEGTGA